jgi:hypothetical protein
MLRSAGSVTPVQPDAAPEPGIGAKSNQAAFERIAISVVGPLSQSNQGSQHLLITMDCFTKWPEAYVIPNQEASTVVEAPVSNFFCRFGVLQELRSDHGRNFISRLIQEVSQCLGVSNTPAPTIGWHG